MNTETWVLMPIYSKRVNRYAVKKSQSAGFPIYKLINWHLDCAELANGIVQPLIAHQLISSGHTSHSHLVSECDYSYFNITELNSSFRKGLREMLNQRPCQVHMKAC